MVITDAPLDPDPLFEGQICDRCKLCVSECPTGAISENETIKIVTAGREIEWNKLDVAKCTFGHHGINKNVVPFAPDIDIEKINIKGDDYEKASTAWEIVYGLTQNIPLYEGLRGWHYHWALCGARGCIRACMVHLEEEGRIGAKFANKFRKRKPWWKIKWEGKKTKQEKTRGPDVGI